jgi:3-isopropylmalate dehydrogenase
MLRFSLGLETEARRIEEIVTQVLAEGYRTADIVSDGTTKLGTKEMGNLIAERITGNSL